MSFAFLAKHLDKITESDPESLIPLKKAAKLFPTPVSLRTVRRYVRQGIKCRITGRTIKLDAVRIDNRRYETSRQAIRSFLERKAGAK